MYWLSNRPKLVRLATKFSELYGIDHVAVYSCGHAVRVHHNSCGDGGQKGILRFRLKRLWHWLRCSIKEAKVKC